MECQSPFSSEIGPFSIGNSAIDLPLFDVTYPVLGVIPSYLYWQYQDDDDLQAFVSAFNTLAQQVVDWFLQLLLPIYTMQDAAMLDWVGRGLYGINRPVLGVGNETQEGPYDTFLLDELAINQSLLVSNLVFAPVDDDTYKRVITWHFWKGDGRQFDVIWLKRRVVRFLAGLCGTDPGVDQTYLVSVTFGIDQVNVRLLTHDAYVVGADLFDVPAFDELAFDEIDVTTRRIAEKYALAQVFTEALQQGALEVPFEWSWNVQARDPEAFVRWPFQTI